MRSDLEIDLVQRTAGHDRNLVIAVSFVPQAEHVWIFGLSCRARCCRPDQALPNYAFMEEIPTHVLEAMVRRFYREGSHTREEVKLY